MLQPRAEPGEERVILVDTRDVEVGSEEKLQAHRDARLHRAFSVFVFDSAGRLLCQRRALTKYHSPGLWSNTCCSHPRPGEGTTGAARRRLWEEMGLRCELEEVHAFIYRADLGQGMHEHEYDHVYFGTCDLAPRPDPREVDGWEWMPIGMLLGMMERDPRRFTVWFRLAMGELGERGLLRDPRAAARRLEAR
jgi:isopentenyl-diphosphate Delta-isomerase